jgi:hypothetical protein
VYSVQCSAAVHILLRPASTGPPIRAVRWTSALQGYRGPGSAPHTLRGLPAPPITRKRTRVQWSGERERTTLKLVKAKTWRAQRSTVVGWLRRKSDGTSRKLANLTAEQVRRKEGAGDGTVMGNKMENSLRLEACMEDCVHGRHRPKRCDGPRPYLDTGGPECVDLRKLEGARA